MRTKGSVHIIMPIGSDPNFRLKQAAIRRGIEAAGFEPHFPDYQVASPSFEASRFAEQLKSASAVLADLTGERPSCYFEIGFALALDRPLYLIAESGTPIHQSASHHVIRHYRDLGELEEVVADLLANGEPRRSGGARVTSAA